MKKLLLILLFILLMSPQSMGALPSGITEREFDKFREFRGIPGTHHLIHWHSPKIRDKEKEIGVVSL